MKDPKGNPVAGLTWRDFKVYENNKWEPLKIFSVDPAPLSMAFVVDQSLTSDVMAKVNDSLGAIQGALSPYDEIAVFTYNNGPREWTEFTGAQGNRVPAVLAMAKSSRPRRGCADQQRPVRGLRDHARTAAASIQTPPSSRVARPAILRSSRFRKKSTL